jgi:F-type H+-transporting ATPase subunit O
LNKEEDIKIISAKELTAAEKEQVVKSIKTQKPDVRFKLSYEIDATILGGLQIYAGTDFLDCSLRSRIEKLKSELAKIA